MAQNRTLTLAADRFRGRLVSVLGISLLCVALLVGQAGCQQAAGTAKGPAVEPSQERVAEASPAQQPEATVAVERQPTELAAIAVVAPSESDENS